MFEDIPRNVWRYSPERLATFPGILATFPGTFGNIPRNICQHFPKGLRRLPGIFEDIPWDVWQHSPEYNIPPIPRIPRIPFPVPVFLVLYIAIKECVFFYLMVLNKKIWRNAITLKSKKVQGTFRKTFILELLSSAVFRLKNCAQISFKLFCSGDKRLLSQFLRKWVWFQGLNERFPKYLG